MKDIIETLYDNAEVVKSFQIEHEKMAMRTFKEGLRPPLKHRMVYFDLKSLDELIKKAVEEEPYVTVLKSSLNSDNNQTSSTKPNNPINNPNHIAIILIDFPPY